MRCIFVLDLFNGAVVHAVIGERSRYEPIEQFSKIVTSSDPIEIIGAIRPKEVYIADLNLIMGTGDNLAAIRKISMLSETMADIGASQIMDLNRLHTGISPVLGTETASLRLIEEASLSRNIIASIDIKNGRTLTKDPEMILLEPMELLRILNGCPLEAVILLNLDRVGVSSGIDRGFLEEAASLSDHSLILGGGISGIEDLKSLEDIGFEGALISTAVHNGRIPLDMTR